MKLQFVTYLFILVTLPTLACKAQLPEMTLALQENVKTYNAKIDELIAKHTQNGFKIMKEKKLPLRSDIEMVIQLNLYEGNWYHFCFIGDPSAQKIKATLFLEGIGNLIEDKIIVKREHEFWTEFSYPCLHSGVHELTLYQKSEISKPLSYLTIFKKQ